MHKLGSNIGCWGGPGDAKAQVSSHGTVQCPKEDRGARSRDIGQPIRVPGEDQGCVESETESVGQ